MAADPMSVSKAVTAAKGSVSELGTMLVMGEVTGFRGPNARSGHCYFQVKDEVSAMDTIVWRGVYEASGVKLRDGMQIVITGSFDVYVATGRLSFVARRITVAGEGLLRQQVAELARKLEREGLMDPARKRSIPRFCERIAVVTSLSGSAIDDVKRTLARRNPLVNVQIAGCKVQGSEAPASIIRALNSAAAVHPDAILLVRGGGSFEDLMTFNDETLARAVAACPVPVICGIGHEPDTSICDMVADRRCSTPTAAAESVAPALDEIVEQIDSRRKRLFTSLWSHLEREGIALGSLGDRLLRAERVSVKRYMQIVETLAQHRCLTSPTVLLEERSRAIELTAERIHSAIPKVLVGTQKSVNTLSERLTTVGPHIVSDHRRQVETLCLELKHGIKSLLPPRLSSLSNLAASLDALSPLRVLARGYAIVRDDEGHVVSSAALLSVGSSIHVRLAKGAIVAEVTDRESVESEEC